MAYGICFEGGYEAYKSLVLKERVKVNDPMERGLRFEEPIMQWAADNNGWTFRKIDTVRWEQDGVPYRDTADFIGLNVDGEEFLCEVKSHSTWMEKEYGEEFGSQVPDRIAVQCQMHCEANNKDSCRVIAFFGVKRPQIYTVYRDAEMWALIHEKCKQFWQNHVVPKEMPPVDGSEICAGLLSRIAQSDDLVVVGGEKDQAKDRRYLEINEAIEALTAEKTELGNWFRERIGSSVAIEGETFRYSHKANRPKVVVNYQAIVRELAPAPEMIEKHTTITEGNRVLRRLKPKGEVNHG
jgi:predicted phage-related endonuclease|tara:strand:- start:4467 stop:5354 length:888 start_codon:yes stop_codon:yes gene_type:complete